MITVEQVALKLGKAPQVIRILLQRGLLPFGLATKMPDSSVYTYLIYPEKFKEYCGEIENTVNAFSEIPSTAWISEDIFKELFEDYKTEFLGSALDHEYYKLIAELDGAVYATVIRERAGEGY